MGYWLSTNGIAVGVIVAVSIGADLYPNKTNRNTAPKNRLISDAHSSNCASDPVQRTHRRNTACWRRPIHSRLNISLRTIHFAQTIAGMCHQCRCQSLFLKLRQRCQPVRTQQCYSHGPARPNRTRRSGSVHLLHLSEDRERSKGPAEWMQKPDWYPSY